MLFQSFRSVSQLYNPQLVVSLYTKILYCFWDFSFMLNRSYLGRIERGEVNLTILKLYVIAKSLDISPKDLLP